MDTSPPAVIATIILLSTLKCIYTCPVTCICSDETAVSCRNQSLIAVPGDVPKASEVVSLDLSENHISSLAGVFQSFINLQVLDLSYNNVTIVQLEDFQNNTKLTNLYLKSNVISEIHPEAFRTVQDLTFLSLEDNLISSLPIQLFRGLNKLERLSLHGNHLSNLSADVFNDLQSLASLDLSFNGIRDINSAFETMYSLDTLDLSHNEVTAVNGNGFHENNTLAHLNLSHNHINCLYNLSNLVHLQTLDLRWNNITVIPPQVKDLPTGTFDGLANLTVMLLDGNPVETIEAAVFSDLRSLQTLSLSHMPNLKYLSPHTFDGLDKLITLNLHNNSLLSFIHKQLFLPLQSISIIDISFNSIKFLPGETFLNNTQLRSLDIRGNSLACDCHLEWILNLSMLNISIIQHSDMLECLMSNQSVNLHNISLQDLHCSQVKIVYYSTDSKFKIGRSATLQCVAEGVPTPEITWVTPRKRVLHYHNFHEYSALDYLPLNDSAIHAKYHASHEWHEQPSYYSQSEDRTDRIVILEDGSLYIDYVLRSDGGPYRCIAKNPRNTTEVVITFYLDYSIIGEVQIWSLVVGGACAGAFFLLNLIYSLTLAAIRRCISQRRRERIKKMIETMDQYKSMQLTRIKDNYTHQVGRIRDQYHYQLGRLREHHQSQMSRMGRMREGASQRVERLRDNYNNRLGQLKDYSSNQMVQIREKYNNQIYRIKDYGNGKMDRIQEKYRLKQQHVIKLFEMMNLDNCKTVFETECVRTESMILDSDIFSTDVPMPSPLGSVSVTDSDEYLTATSSESSKYSSRENLNSALADNHGETGNSFDPVSQTVRDGDHTYQVVNEEENAMPIAGHVDPLLGLEADKKGEGEKHKPKKYKPKPSNNTINSDKIEVYKPRPSSSSAGCNEAEIFSSPSQPDELLDLDIDDLSIARLLHTDMNKLKATGLLEVDMGQPKPAKRRSGKGRKLRESAKRRSKSEMVLKLPHDELDSSEETIDLLRGRMSHRHKRSVKSVKEVDMFSDDIDIPPLPDFPELLIHPSPRGSKEVNVKGVKGTKDKEASVDASGSKEAKGNDVIELASGVVKESTV